MNYEMDGIALNVTLLTSTKNLNAGHALQLSGFVSTARISTPLTAIRPTEASVAVAPY